MARASTDRLALGGLGAQDASVPVPPAVDAAVQLEYAETACVTLEWRVGGLKSIFEASRGESKSKCIKSAVFGDPDNLWELLMYANSGPTAASASNQSAQPGGGTSSAPAGEYASFYLSAVPTHEEKDTAIKGKWQRKGLFAFRFEIKTLGRAVIATKEATNHVFSSKTINWGWQSFAKRDNLYYAQPQVKAADAFLVCCTVASYPTPPAGFWLAPHAVPSSASLSLAPSPSSANPAGAPPPAPAWAGSAGGWKGLAGGNGAMATDGARALVPRSLVGAFGGLFNDPAYSDVAFLLPRRQRERNETRMRRAQWTRAAATAGAAGDEANTSRTASSDNLVSAGGAHEAQTDNASTFVALSSAPEEVQAASSARGEASAAGQSGFMTTRTRAGGSKGEPKYHKVWAIKKVLRRADYFVGMLDSGFAEGRARDAEDDESELNDSPDDTAGDDSDMEEERSFGLLEAEADDDNQSLPDAEDSGPRKTEVVITEAAHRTWKALIYYLYTDTITFAPLTSSFIATSTIPFDDPDMAAAGSVAPGTSFSVPRWPAQGRREWIKTWLAEHPGESDRPAPCSAKAIYRLADKFDLPSLRQRAFQHIVSQLTVQNIPYEAFSSFSATYEQVRKIEVAFFLAHWNELKGSQAMANIWQHIRLGRHRGFEEVWPYIVSNLEFKSSRDETAVGSVLTFRDDMA